MLEWTQGAREYLEGYLRQVGALAGENGDDAREIVEQLRDHVHHEVGALEAPLVTVDLVKRVLTVLGTPEMVVSGEWGVPRNAEPARRAEPVPPVLAPPPAAPPPAAPPQTVILQERRGCSRGCLLLAVLALVLFMSLPILGILAGITLPAISRAREAAHRASCQGNLKLVASILAQYHQQHGGSPPLSKNPGELMFSSEKMEGDRTAFRKALHCPLRPGTEAAEWPGDDSYLYLPYQLTNVEDVEIFCKAYGAAVQKGEIPAGEALVAPEPEAHRAVAWVDDLKGTNAAKTPILVERPGIHESAGCNVLYLDGHVEFVRMGEKFPVLPEVFQALTAIDMLDGDRAMDLPGQSTHYVP